MNSLTFNHQSINRETLAGMTSAARFAHLKSLIGISVEAVSQAAIVLAVMQEQGDDITHLPLHLRQMLRRVYDQQILPEVVTSLGGRLRQRVQLLPLAEQRRIVDGGLVTLLPNPEAEPVEINPQHLTPGQIMQVFAEGYLRPVQEQKVFLLSQHIPKPKALTRLLDIRTDKIRNGLVIEGVFIPRDRIARLLSQLK